MTAVWMFVTSTTRVALRGTVGVVVAIALFTGTVAATAIGALRTATAPERITVARGGDLDAIIQYEGPPASDLIGDLPAVASAAGYTFVFAFPDGRGDNVNPFAGELEGTVAGRPDEGRAPRPDTAGEYVANSAFIDRFGIEIGDTVPFRYLRIDEAEAFFGGDNTVGSVIDATLVGRVDGPLSLENPVPTVLFSPALLTLGVGTVATLTSVTLAPGATLETLREQVEAIPGIVDPFLAPGEIVNQSTRDAVRLQATAMWMTTVLTALAGGAVIVQLIRRHRSRHDTDRTLLRSLGFPHRSFAQAEALWTSGVAGLGCALGAALALPASTLFPVGFVRRIDPDLGRIITPAWLPVTIAVVLALAIVTSVTALSAPRPRPPRAVAHRPSGLVARLPFGGPASIGVRAALAPARHRRSNAWSLITLAACLSGVVAAGVFGASLNRLVTDPARFGSAWDVVIGNDFDNEPLDVPDLGSDADVLSAMLMNEVPARVNGADAELIGVESLKGGLLPVVLAGRFPDAPDEVALGQVTRRELGVAIGERVDVTVADGEVASLRVVGEVVVPVPSFGQGAGQGAVVLLTSLGTLAPGLEQPRFVALELAPGADPPASMAEMVSAPSEAGNRPAVVVNLAWLRPVPIVAIVILATFAVLTLAHMLIVSIARRRRDLAVLRTMGARSSWVRTSIVVHALVVVAVAAAIAVPLGVLLGRGAFRALAGFYGVVPTAAFPALRLAAVFAMLMIGAALAALAVAQRSAHRSIASELHAD